MSVGPQRTTSPVSDTFNPPVSEIDQKYCFTQIRHVNFTANATSFFFAGIAPETNRIRL